MFLLALWMDWQQRINYQNSSIIGLVSHLIIDIYCITLFVLILCFFFLCKIVKTTIALNCIFPASYHLLAFRKRENFSLVFLWSCSTWSYSGKKYESLVPEYTDRYSVKLFNIFCIASSNAPTLHFWYFHWFICVTLRKYRDVNPSLSSSQIFASRNITVSCW